MSFCTEQEAAKRWCPAARVDVNDAAAANRWPSREGEEGEGDDEAQAGTSNTCLGSRCMWWRWDATAFDRVTLDLRAGAKGYCGMAGRPTQ